MNINMLIPIFLTLTSIVKFVEPKIEKSEWKSLNEKLKEKLVPKSKIVWLIKVDI